MKRIATAVLLVSLATPALAIEIGAPYSQLNIDRQLPDVKDPATNQSAAAGASAAQHFTGYQPGTPYFTLATGPWANDWNFIAPAP